MKVLVLEHSRLYQKVLRELLEAQDCDVDCARSGEEGLESLRNREYGLIIAGQHIFDDSSDEFISYYTTLSNRCPVILLTSEPNDALLNRAREAGITDIFPKSNMTYLADSIRFFIRGESLIDIKGGRVLYVEDSKSVAHAMKRYLEKLNLVITHYANAEDALNDFIANDYDLVITDVMLEGNIDGVSLVRMIRAQNNIQSQTPILALTSFDDPHRRIELFRAGVNDYVTKPPVEEELAARVNNLITNKHTLHEMAMNDQLTGCHNRHSLVEYAPKVLQDADRYNYPLSIMILDLDHFKLINDKHGHTVGDDVLADVGKQLRACCRQGDFVCRLGGEEFIMILPHCNSGSAKTKAEELRTRIENSTPGGIYVTASIGIASLSQRHKQDFDRLYKDADEAVYQSKKNGRNMVSQFDMAVS
jgi:two-component system cell cycle response regulator